MAGTILQAGIGALNIAGSLSGVPYAGTAGVLLQQIQSSCQQIAVHKRKCKLLAMKCSQLLSTLDDQSRNLEGSDLQSASDEVISTLETVSKRVNRWSGYSRILTFVKSAEIEAGLDKCMTDVETAMEIFHISSNIILHKFQREMQETLRSNSAETHDLLLKILTDKQELRNIQEMQNDGQPIAESIMAAGQLKLRKMREDADRSNRRRDSRSHTVQWSPVESRDSERYLQYSRGLVALRRTTGIPPAVKSLNGEVTKIGDLAIAGGAFSDIWLGKWLGEEEVALRALRNVKATDPKAKQRFEREILVWATLQHENVLPFYGIVTDLGQHIHMVSPWQELGDVLEYVKLHPEADKLHLLSGAAKGLEYIHSRQVIHGNVKCSNFLVSATGEARICDFGMSKIIEDVTEKSASATLTAAGSTRWLAPELIEGTISSPTANSDTYSFGMTVLELFTLKHPYADRKRDASVIRDVIVLKRKPARPTNLEDDNLWSLINECWLYDAALRPTMKEVAGRLCTVASGITRTCSPEPIE